MLVAEVDFVESGEAVAVDDSVVGAELEPVLESESNGIFGFEDYARVVESETIAVIECVFDRCRVSCIDDVAERVVESVWVGIDTAIDVGRCGSGSGACGAEVHAADHGIGTAGFEHTAHVERIEVFAVEEVGFQCVTGIVECGVHYRAQVDEGVVIVFGEGVCGGVYCLVGILREWLRAQYGEPPDGCSTGPALSDCGTAESDGEVGEEGIELVVCGMCSPIFV